MLFTAILKKTRNSAVLCTYKLTTYIYSTNSAVLCTILKNYWCRASRILDTK